MSVNSEHRHRHGSSAAPASDAISPLASLGANPCNPMSGKPVATVPPSFTVRLAAIFKLSKVKSTSLRGGVCQICGNEISYSGAILVSSYGRGRPTNPFSTACLVEIYCSYKYEQFNQNKEPDKAARRD